LGRRAPLGFFLENENPKRKLADVVEKTAQIGLFFLEVIHLASDAFAEQSREKTVLPEGGELLVGQTLTGELHQ